MKFAFFFLAEFANMFVVAAIASVIFLGAWNAFLPWQFCRDRSWSRREGFCLILVIMWLRWTLPRLRVDQLMHVCWKVLIPISFLLDRSGGADVGLPREIERMNAVAKYLSDLYKGVSTALVGMWVTGREAFKQPDHSRVSRMLRWQLPERYRGILHNRIEDCIGCMACARACPGQLHPHPDRAARQGRVRRHSDGTTIKLWIPQFDIDMALCMECGLCTEPCPTECLTMTKEYELAVQDKKDMYLEFAVERDEEIAARKQARRRRLRQRPRRRLRLRRMRRVAKEE